MTILTQLDAITHDYFMIMDGKAQDNYFETSFLLNYFLKQKKGIYKKASGGKKISVPIRYDGNKAGFFVRGGTVDSTKQEAITNVEFAWKYLYGNATIYFVDSLLNSGEAALIDLVTEELYGAQESLRDIAATSLYNGLEGDTDNLTGLNSLTNTTATVDYGGYTENEIVSADGTKVWAGKGSSSTTLLSLAALRTIKTACAYGKGKSTHPDLMSTSEANYDTILNIVQTQQRFTKDGEKTAKIGFRGLDLEGTDIFPDRYCPASNLYALNSDHCGFVVHKDADFMKTPWEFIAGSVRDKTMKIVLATNFVCNNRRANYRHSAIS